MPSTGVSVRISEEQASIPSPSIMGTMLEPDLPSYTSVDTRIDPPAYTAPSAYRIGGTTLGTPLVHLHHLRAHLALLRAFKVLRSAVEGAPGLGLEGGKMEGTAKWAWFVGLAVERFQRWAAGVRPGTLQRWVAEELPPIDVLMVWHAYLLNPGWYAEDCLRLPIMKTLGGLGDRYIHAVVEMGDLAQYQPSSERIASWQEQTGTPWDPLEAAAQMKHRTIRCPKCLTSANAPYLTADGTGYAQHKFALACAHCGCAVTLEKLAVRKFMRDLTEPYQGPELAFGGYFAGTLFTQTNATNTARAEAVKGFLLRMGTFRKSDEHMSRKTWEDDVLKKLDYSLLRARAAVNIALRSGGRRLPTRIFSAYTDDRPFSIDLVGAVVRQGSFIDKMYAFGWTEPGYFDDKEDELVLVHATARYHAFLDLMSSSPMSFFVPTLDIDLVWHSHQLMGSRYANECARYVKRYIDHDDKVEENHLATSFDVTCRAWEERFKLPYTHCGCPLPGETIGRRLSRLSQNLFHTANSDTPSALRPPPRADALSATHASEHNAIAAGGGLHAARVEHHRRARAEKLARRRQRDAERVRAGRMDAQAFERGRAHDAAFLTPVPFYYPVAAVLGHVLEGAGVVVGAAAEGVAEGAHLEDAAAVEDAEVAEVAAEDAGVAEVAAAVEDAEVAEGLGVIVEDLSTKLLSSCVLLLCDSLCCWMYDYVVLFVYLVSLDLSQVVTGLTAEKKAILRFKEAVHSVMSAAGDLKAEVLATDNAHIHAVSEGIRKVLTVTLEELQAEFTPSGEAPGHETRKARVTETLRRAKDAILKVLVGCGVSETTARTHLDNLYPHIEFLIIMIGDLAEQNPVSLTVLLHYGTVLLIPESWLLRALLGLFGFPPVGPVKDMIASHAQHFFFGAPVRKDRGFTFLQVAAMRAFMRMLNARKVSRSRL
ncbi:hypothetical protein SCP_1602450 [Sparassis crispa]|uniref:Uncharacterized protein n=1 Tax=Sparassis crispa TaxID=139825 RepID=A0A401H593_9APHY|nr:hypothetical protein SCP_1602450 [Sparassis crispa]GBE89582.1 hypothetical protein SCP_1602450 [Sparassis crispa]